MPQQLDTPETAVDIRFLVKDEWFVSSGAIRQSQLWVDHLIHEPDTLEISGSDHHGFCIQFNAGTCQVAQVGDQEYDGPIRPGDIWFLPANTSAFWHWETRDKVLAFCMDTPELPVMQWFNANMGELIGMSDPEIVEFRQGKSRSAIRSVAEEPKIDQ